jgi:hypothetical protein
MNIAGQEIIKCVMQVSVFGEILDNDLPCA